MKDFGAIILAAGIGKRMKSKYPKVLHRACGRPMVSYVVKAALKAGATRCVVVEGYKGDLVRESLAAEFGDKIRFAHQAEQLGTAHAVMQAAGEFADFKGHVVVLCGDTPLITSETIERLRDKMVSLSASGLLLSTKLEDPSGYGRIVRDDAGRFLRIVEDKDASPAEREIKEINSGIYCFEAEALFDSLSKVSSDNAQGEYYLTDVMKLILEAGKVAEAYEVDGWMELKGVNSRDQLAEAEAILRDRKRLEVMENGVTLIDPGTTFIDDDVEIGRDTVIYPFTFIEKGSVIGEDCAIGPNCRIISSKIGNYVTAESCKIVESEVRDSATIGPFAYIRPGSVLMECVKVGDFVEIKNSTVGRGSKVPHLSYVGDATVGEKVNIGCGTITCNYDGEKKYRTEIGDGVFIGSNTNLVAPVKIGDEAYVAAGSTITEDVPSKSLAIGRARQVVKEGWVDKKRKN